MVKRCLETVSLRTLWPFASGMPSSTKQCSARESLNQFKKAGTKSWNMRALDPDFKPASSPDEEMTRNDKLLAVLAKLKAELPEVEKPSQAFRRNGPLQSRRTCPKLPPD